MNLCAGWRDCLGAWPALQPGIVRACSDGAQPVDGWRDDVTGKFLKCVMYFSIAAAALAAPQAQAQGTKVNVEGTYCLAGMREVGSCFRFSPGGKYEYFLSYGAYDEKSEGKWRLENGAIVIDSLPYDKRSSFTYKGTQKGDNPGYVILVVGRNGRGIQGVDVRLTCDGKEIDGYTQSYGLELECKGPPTSVDLSLRMFNVPPQTVAIPAKPGDEKVFVFEFEPGDIGKRKFTAQRIAIEPDGKLLLIAKDAPIADMNGVPFRYERQAR
jgi:hypothetical protein